MSKRVITLTVDEEDVQVVLDALRGHLWLRDYAEIELLEQEL